jgi:hypothetical protein
MPSGVGNSKKAGIAGGQATKNNQKKIKDAPKVKTSKKGGSKPKPKAKKVAAKKAAAKKSAAAKKKAAKKPAAEKQHIYLLSIEWGGRWEDTEFEQVGAFTSLDLAISEALELAKNPNTNLGVHLQNYRCDPSCCHDDRRHLYRDNKYAGDGVLLELKDNGEGSWGKMLIKKMELDAVTEREMVGDTEPPDSGSSDAESDSSDACTDRDSEELSDLGGTPPYDMCYYCWHRSRTA